MLPTFLPNWMGDGRRWDHSAIMSSVMTSCIAGSRNSGLRLRQNAQAVNLPPHRRQPWSICISTSCWFQHWVSVS